MIAEIYLKNKVRPVFIFWMQQKIKDTFIYLYKEQQRQIAGHVQNQLVLRQNNNMKQWNDITLKD